MAFQQTRLQKHSVFTGSDRLTYGLKIFIKVTSAACLISVIQACAVIAVADAAVTVVATGVKVTAKAVGAVADAVIP